MTELLTCILFVTAAVLSGALNGLREASHSDLRIFERAWGLSETGWFGSHSWLWKYKDYPEDKRERFPGSKSFMAWATDFWHFSGMASKTLIVVAALVAGNFGWWHAGLLLALYGGSSHVAYVYLKKKARNAANQL